MTPAINFINFVRQKLPAHKRKQIRMTILRALVWPLHILFAAFNTWRSYIRMMVNVNSQVKILESYLRKKYNEPISIKIETYNDGLLLVCLEEEGLTMMPAISLEQEGEMASVPLDGEIRDTFGNADFIVYIPKTVSIEDIRAEIERYKMALTKFLIIQK